MRELKYFVVCSVHGFIAGGDGSTDAFVNDEDYLAELFEALPETRPAHLRRALGGEVRVCAPPDFAELLAPCRRVAGPDRPAGSPDGARGDTADGGGPAPAHGRVGRRAVRHGRRGGRGM
jgi:hypothetical protein